MFCPICGTAPPAASAYCPRCGAPLVTQAGPSPDPDWRHFGIDRVLPELRDGLAPRYDIVRPLGAGGMGAVLLAREPVLERFVAVKVLAPALAANESARARFRREGLAAAAISHPNVVAVYGVGETAKSRLPYIVMQYVEGAPLDAWVAERGRLNEKTLRRLIGEAAAALAAAHSRGLVHRDMKPGNILVERESGRALVVDFGVSGLLASRETPVGPSLSGEHDPRLTGVGQIIGTPIYMSPEQAAGDTIEARSDVYSLGIVAFELATGKLPFYADSLLGWATVHLTAVPPRLEDLGTVLPFDVARILDRCLAKAAKDRPTAAELAKALLPAAEPELVWPPPPLLPLQRTGALLRRGALVGAAGAVLLAATLAFPPQALQPRMGWWDTYRTSQVVKGSSLGVVRESGSSRARFKIVAWQVVLSLASVAGLFGLGVASASALRAEHLAVRHNERGWRWDTLLDAIADPDGRSGAAALRPQRRRLVFLSAGAALFALGVLGTWSIAIVSGAWSLRGAAPVVPVILLPLMAPIVAAIGLAFWLQREDDGEARLVPLPAATTERAIPGGPPEDHTPAAWYASHDGLGLPATGAPPAPARLAWLLAMLAVPALAAIGLLALAVLTGSRRLERAGPVTAALAERAELEEGGPFAQLDRLLAASATPPAQATVDSAGAWLALLADATLPPYAASPAELLAALDTTEGDIAARATVAMTRANGASITPAMESVATHPRTLAFRRLAGTAALGATRDIPFGGLRDAAQANALGAVVALTRSDMGTARSRLAENGAIARAVLNGPDVFSVRFGAGMLQDLAVLPLAALEERTGNRVAAESLRVAVERVREEAFAAHWDEGFAGLASDPRHPELLLKAARNPSFPKGLRAAAGAGVLMGICLNPREILSGIDPGRAATMTVLLGEESPRPPTASNPDTTRSALGRSGIGDLFRRLSSCP